MSRERPGGPFRPRTGEAPGRFGLPLRQRTGFVASLPKLAGLDWPVPDASTPCRRQRTLPAQPPYRGGANPLHLLVDGTGITAPASRSGIKVRGEGEWHARKHGGARRRVRRKVHLATDLAIDLAIDEATLEGRAVEITGSGVGDAPMLPDLLDQSPEDEPIASVTTDGARSARSGRDAIANRGADAVIPPRRNAKPWKKNGPGAEMRNEALRAIKHLGRTLMARDLDRQTAELQLRIAILNRHTTLGTPVTRPVGRPQPGKEGKTGLHGLHCLQATGPIDDLAALMAEAGDDENGAVLG